RLLLVHTPNLIIARHSLPQKQVKKTAECSGCTFDNAPADWNARHGMPQHHRGEGGIVGRTGLLGPRYHLVGVLVEGPKHFFKQGRSLATPICCKESQSDDLQSDVGTASLVRDRKTVPSETEFAPSDQSDADRTGTDDDDGSVRTSMGTETGCQPVADEANRCEGMRNLFE